jgi:16S rRNA (cytidine1402-2'-O)-methyltransferase
LCPVVRIRSDEIPKRLAKLANYRQGKQKNLPFFGIMAQVGTLYLIPTPLGEGTWEVLPSRVYGLLEELSCLVVERARTTRQFIRQAGVGREIASYHMSELNEHTPTGELPALLAPLLEGQDVGLLSEAGCPGIADPGAALVRLAHAHGVRVVPLPGPSSVLLALMASGMNGQQFCFHGYLSPQPARLPRDLRQLESQALRTGQTQLFIETPYRNRQVLQQAILHLQAETRFCVAADLTLPTEFIRSLPVADWKRMPLPDLHKRPAVFLLGR